MKLRKAMQKMLTGWKKDLPAPWRAVLEDVDLNFEAVPSDLHFRSGDVIFPPRRHASIKDAPANAHIFRAFDGLKLQEVRAVILGQDPYPNVSWATGRAFEQGNLSDWPVEHKFVADSLARIVQVLAYARTRKRRYLAGYRAWEVLVQDIHRGKLNLEPPAALFDYLQRQGVLFLNASLTLGRFTGRGSGKQLQSFFSLWRPVIARILMAIATRKSEHAVFLLWGNAARDIFRRTHVQSSAEDASTWKVRANIVRHPHPAAITRDGPVFLKPPNPFLQANRVLKAMDATPIEW
jgi:uracil-DNA glycosylase